MSMLYALEKFGYKKASDEFFEKYYSKKRASESTPVFINVLKGKLLFLQMIKNPRDRVYVSLAKEFNRLMPDGDKPLRFFESTDKEKNALNSIWVLESLYDDHNGEVKASQGTGFLLNGVGLVTCAHVVSEGDDIFDNIKAFKCDSIGQKYDIHVVCIDKHRDIAILEIVPNKTSQHATFNELHLDMSDSIKHKMPITLMGFPAYKLGQSAYLADGKIASVYTQSGVKKFEIDILIREGNSGGPVLNSNFDVIGIAAEGAEKTGGNNAVIRICELSGLLEQKKP
jgi:S1-C subfamily serine protease